MTEMIKNKKKIQKKICLRFKKQKRALLSFSFGWKWKQKRRFYIGERNVHLETQKKENSIGKKWLLNGAHMHAGHLGNITTMDGL